MYVIGSSVYGVTVAHITPSHASCWRCLLCQSLGTNFWPSRSFQRFTQFATSLDTDDLSHLCKILYTSDFALDILALHIKLTELVFRALGFLEEYDCGTVGGFPCNTGKGKEIYQSSGDPQTAVSHLGDIVLLVQYTIVRFRVRVQF